MQENTFSWTPDSIDKVNTSAKEELARKNVPALERQSDRQLVGMFKIKGERGASVNSLDLGAV